MENEKAWHKEVIPGAVECVLPLLLKVDFNVIHALKSLTYFKDAENEPMPKMLAPISWDQVTRFFRLEAPKLV
jgi:hypothetical protein